MRELANNMELLLYLIIVLSMVVSYLVVWIVSLKQEMVHLQKDMLGINDSMRYMMREIEILHKGTTVYTSIGGL